MATKPAPVPTAGRVVGKHALICNDASLAVQSQKDEADINTIVRNFGVTGTVNVPIVLPSYGDFEGIDDYRSALEAVKAAQESFAALPSSLRERFHNDPGAFVEFCENPKNLPELRQLGLANPEPTPETSAQTG